MEPEQAPRTWPPNETPNHRRTGWRTAGHSVTQAPPGALPRGVQPRADQLQLGGGPGGKEMGAGLKERDELYEPAIEIVTRECRGSCSPLQRAWA